MADGTVVNRIASWDGSHWAPLGTGLSEPFNNPHGQTVGVWNNQLVVGGYFTARMLSKNLAASLSIASHKSGIG